MNPMVIIKQLHNLYKSLEDIYLVSNESDLNKAIESIGKGSGTIKRNSDYKKC